MSLRIRLEALEKVYFVKREGHCVFADARAHARINSSLSSFPASAFVLFALGINLYIVDNDHG